MSRRLKGYAIRCDNGEWFDGTGLGQYSECPWTADRAKRHLFDEAADAYTYASTYTESSKLRIVPVFAVRKPKPAPVVAAEGLFACLVEAGGGRRFFREFRGKDLVEAGTRAEAEAIAGAPGTIGTSVVVRILPDGAHEAACEAARREERERVLAEVEAYAARAAKRIAQADPHSWAGGRSGAFAEIAEAVRTMGEEKGQAK